MYQKKILSYQMRVNEETGEVYKGYFEEIDNTLEAKQAYVGGCIEVIRITPEIDIILHDEGKIRRLSPNRAWLDNDNIVDILVGNLLCVRNDEEGNFTSILKEDEATILKHLKPVAVLNNACILMPEIVCSEYKQKE